MFRSPQTCCFSYLGGLKGRRAVAGHMHVSEWNTITPCSNRCLTISCPIARASTAHKNLLMSPLHRPRLRQPGLQMPISTLKRFLGAEVCAGKIRCVKVLRPSAFDICKARSPMLPIPFTAKPSAGFGTKAASTICGSPLCVTTTLSLDTTG
jgi:hypothetical protein